jgi:alpha-mannosidase
MGRMKEHVASGRLEIAGDMHAMPDANLPSGESFVRQILYGRRYFATVLGTTSRIGWMLDSFGHHPQVPQIMRKKVSILPRIGWMLATGNAVWRC